MEKWSNEFCKYKYIAIAPSGAVLAFQHKPTPNVSAGYWQTNVKHSGSCLNIGYCENEEVRAFWKNTLTPVKVPRS